MTRIYKREQYLKKLRPFYDSDIIKIVTGIRRCGKSCLMASAAQEIKDLGVPESDIIDINLDKRGFKSIRTPEQLEIAIDSRITDDRFKYIFIDEIQNVPGYEEVINAFREDGNVSIFITGSNSYLLSGELMTKLTGRYIEFKMFPLNFAEYIGMKRFIGIETLESASEEFEHYMRFGGFPKTLEFTDAEAKLHYANGVIGQILEKDVRGNAKIRNRDIFDRVMTFVINNYGAPTSASRIAEHFSSNSGVKIKRDTIARYLSIMQNAEIINKCQRFDLKTRKSLASEEKFYLSDLSIYGARDTDNRIGYGPSLENIFYIYMRSKGYSVSVGKIGNLECDFIVRKNDDFAYVQVAMSIADPKVEEREYRVFERIRDSYPCYLFTLDPLLRKRNGVIHLNLIDFMANDNDLF